MRLRGKYKKESGIFMPLSCMLGKYSIGSLGKSAYDFIDFLTSSGQKYWDIGALSPTVKKGKNEIVISSFAGEILYIDIDMLIRDGYLYEPEIKKEALNQKEENLKTKRNLIELAASRVDKTAKSYKNFIEKNSFWLTDFAVYEVMTKNGSISIFDVKDNLKLHEPYALESFCVIYEKEIETIKSEQFLFFLQLKRFRDYASKNGIRIIGKINYFVYLESADFWANSKIFKIGSDLTPTSFSAGFNKLPQKRTIPTPFPTYDCDRQRQGVFDFFERKLLTSKAFYNITKIENFNSFADTYVFTTGASSGISGSWSKGFGISFFERRMQSLRVNIIADDTVVTESLNSLKSATDFWETQYFFPTLFKTSVKDYNYNTVCFAGVTAKNIFKPLPEVKKAKTVSKQTVMKILYIAAISKARIVIYPIFDIISESENTVRVDSLDKNTRDTLLRLSKLRKQSNYYMKKPF